MSDNETRISFLWRKGRPLMLLATWHGKFQRHDSSDEEKTSLDTFILLSAVSTYLLWLSFIICRDFNRGIQV